MPAFLLGTRPHWEIICASATKPLAEEFGAAVRNCVDSREYRSLFPSVKLSEDTTAKGRWTTSEGGGYHAVGVGLRPGPKAPPPPVSVQLDAGRPARRVVVVGVDGLSPADVTVARDGGMPAFARLARRGAFSPLATVKPTEGPPFWTTMMTGCLPRDHGIASANTYRLRGSGSDWALLPKAALVGALERAGLASRRPVASTSRRRRAIWNVLDAFGIPTGLVRVWGTHPPETIRGFVVSPYFHLLPLRSESSGHAPSAR